MDNKDTPLIKKCLEDTFDIPFEVEGGIKNGDYWFKIRPGDNQSELFEVHVKLVNKLRLVIEVYPEDYAVSSIKEMSLSSVDKKNLFVCYARKLELMNAKTSFWLNDSTYSPTNPEEWPQEWVNYRLRVSKSPVYDEEKTEDIVGILTPWIVVVVGMFLSLLTIVSYENGHNHEGGLYRTETNVYERNPVNRLLCLVAHGYKCNICEFDFEKVYGEIGRNYIHVHHIVPVSQMINSQTINPEKDLIPVCPNCHAMLHRLDPPLLPMELRLLLEQIKSIS